MLASGQAITARGSMAASGCRVSGVDQDEKAELGEYTAANASELGAGETKRAQLEVGAEQSGRVPLELEWEVVKDSEDCLRIKRATLRRTGGARDFELYDVKFKPRNERKCVTRLDLGPKFETIDVSYCWRWNGAPNRAMCAYDGSVAISADAVGAEGADVKGAASATR